MINAITNQPPNTTIFVTLHIINPTHFDALQAILLSFTALFLNMFFLPELIRY